LTVKLQPLAVDTEGAAAITTISVSTLEKKRVRGDGPPYVKVGKSVRYLVSDLQAYLASQRVASTSQQRAA
jgi:predicted DNA-binding transcriptional regulator AlpA